MWLNFNTFGKVFIGQIVHQNLISFRHCEKSMNPFDVFRWILSNFQICFDANVKNTKTTLCLSFEIVWLFQFEFVGVWIWLEIWLKTSNEIHVFLKLFTFFKICFKKTASSSGFNHIFADAWHLDQNNQIFWFLSLYVFHQKSTMWPKKCNCTFCMEISMTKTLKLTTPEQNEFNFGAPASINPTRKSMCKCLHKSNPSQTIIFYIWNAKIDNVDASAAIKMIDFDWKTSNGFDDFLTTFFSSKFSISKMPKRINFCHSKIAILITAEQNECNFGDPTPINALRKSMCKCLQKSYSSQTSVFCIPNAKIDNADASAAIKMIDFDWKTKSAERSRPNSENYILSQMVLIIQN